MLDAPDARQVIAETIQGRHIGLDTITAAIVADLASAVGSDGDFAVVDGKVLPPFRHVGRFAAYGHDGHGWLADTDVFVRAEDYDNHSNYVTDGFAVYAENVQLRTRVAELEARLVPPVEPQALPDSCPRCAEVHDEPLCDDEMAAATAMQMRTLAAPGGPESGPGETLGGGEG